MRGVLGQLCGFLFVSVIENPMRRVIWGGDAFGFFVRFQPKGLSSVQKAGFFTLNINNNKNKLPRNLNIDTLQFEHAANDQSQGKRPKVTRIGDSFAVFQGSTHFGFPPKIPSRVSSF